MGVIKGDPKTDDFFEANPEIRYFDHVTELVEEEGEKKAGKVLWALYMSEDPASPFFTYKEDKRRDMIARNFMKDYPDFDWNDYKFLIKIFPNLFLSKAQRDFRTFMLVMEKTRSWLEDQSVDDNIKGVLDNLSKSAKLWKEYEELEERFTKSLLQEEENMRGDRKIGGAAKKRQMMKNTV